MDLVRPHERMVYATVFSLLANKEDAEDVTQDTLMKRCPAVGTKRPCSKDAAVKGPTNAARVALAALRE